MSDRNAVAYSAFSGPRASYVALASMTTLGLVFLTSLWIPDVSGFVGVLGLLAVYLPSKEFLTLYVIFAPTSLFIDIIRLTVSITKDTKHTGWLVFFALLAMIAKGAGGLFAWSLQRSINSDESLYGPLNGAQDPSAFQRVDTSSPYTTFNPPRQEAPQTAAQFPSTDHQFYVPPASTPSA